MQTPICISVCFKNGQSRFGIAHSFITPKSNGFAVSVRFSPYVGVRKRTPPQGSVFSS